MNKIKIQQNNNGTVSFNNIKKVKRLFFREKKTRLNFFWQQSSIDFFKVFVIEQSMYYDFAIEVENDGTHQK